MGYYKRLYSGDIRRPKSNAKLRKAASTGQPIDINVTVDIEELVKEFQRVGNYKGLKKSKVKEIHTKVGESGARAIRKVIVDYPRTINVRRTGRYGGRPGEPVDVQPGTLRRSIGVIDPGNGTNVWVGPRSSMVGGATPYSRKDGWFAHIVNEGDQFLGPGPNRKFFERGLARGTRNMERQLLRLHAKALGNHVTQ